MASPSDSDDMNQVSDISDGNLDDTSQSNLMDESSILSKTDASDVQNTSSSVYGEAETSLGDDTEKLVDGEKSADDTKDDDDDEVYEPSADITDTSTASPDAADSPLSENKLKEILEISDDSGSEKSDSKVEEQVQESNNDQVKYQDEDSEKEIDVDVSDPGDENGHSGEEKSVGESKGDDQETTLEDEVSEKDKDVEKSVESSKEDKDSNKHISDTEADHLDDVNEGSNKDAADDENVTNFPEDDGGEFDTHDETIDEKVTESDANETKEVEKSIETLEVEGMGNDKNTEDTEKELKEIEKSVESITHTPPEAEELDRSHSDSFEASVEKMKSDEEEAAESHPPEHHLQEVEISEENAKASDVEKYMENKEDEGKYPELSRVPEIQKIENEQRQKSDNAKPDQPRQLYESALSTAADQNMTNVSLSDDSDTDSPHSMEESDHFKDRKKPEVPLDALRSDASSTDASHSKSSQHHRTSYGSITSKMFNFK